MLATFKHDEFPHLQRWHLITAPHLKSLSSSVCHVFHKCLLTEARCLILYTCGDRSSQVCSTLLSIQLIKILFTDISVADMQNKTNLQGAFQIICTFFESSLNAFMLELLATCVSEMMKGFEPASKTLWIFPESVGRAI